MPEILNEYQVLFVSLEESEDEWVRCREAAAVVSRVSSRSSRTAFRPFRRVLSEGEDFFDERREKLALERCDFAVFILPEYWASTCCDDSASRLRELWTAAERLYAAAGLRDILLLFKTSPYEEQSGINERSKPALHFTTLSFDGWPETAELYTSQTVHSVKGMTNGIEHALRRWARKPWASKVKFLCSLPGTFYANTVAVPAPPLFDYWISEASRLNASEVSKYHDALFCASKALEASSSDIEWAQATNASCIARHGLDESREAFSAFGEIVSRLVGCADAPSVAWRGIAQFNQMVVLNALPREQDMLAVFDNLAAEYAESTEMSFTVLWAETLLRKASQLAVRQRAPEELAVLRDVAARLGTAEEEPLQELLARTLAEEAKACVRDGAFERSMAVKDDIVARFERTTVPSLRNLAVETLLQKGQILGSRSRPEEAIAVYDDLVRRFGDVPDIACRRVVGSAMCEKAATLEALERQACELVVLKEIDDRFGTEDDVALRYCVAEALCRQAKILRQLGRAYDAIAAYDTVAARFQDSPDSMLRETVAECLFWKGLTLTGIDRDDDAIAAFDEVLARFGPLSGDGSSKMTGYAFVHKAEVLARAGRRSEAIAIYDHIMEHLEPSSSSDVILAAAMYNKVSHMDPVACGEERIALCDAIIERFSKGSRNVRETTAKAVFKKAFTLQTAGRDAEAIEVYDDALARLAAVEEPKFRALTASAQVNKAVSLVRMGAHDESLRLCDEVLKSAFEHADPAMPACLERARILKANIVDSKEAAVVGRCC